MRSLTALKTDQRGNVLMLTGLAILILFAVAGAGVDFGRQQLVRMKLQNASDAAAIAAASLPESTSAEQRRAVALRYYNLNFPGTYLGVVRPTPNIQVGNQIIVDASTSFETNFVSNVDVNRLEAQGRTVVDRATQAASIYDVLLVMDNSGSMADATTASGFADTPQADHQNTRNLINLKCEEERRLIANAYCQAGDFTMADLRTTRRYSSTALCRANYPSNYCSTFTNERTIYVNGKRAGAYGFIGNTRMNALRRVALDFVTRIIDEGEVGSRIGLVGWSDQVLTSQVLNNNTTIIRNRINSMASFAGTNPSIGMREAINLSGSFNPRSIKAVVLLTDGKPTQAGSINYAGAPANPTDSSGCNGQAFCTPAVNATLPLCTQLKNNGVQVYTIGFLNRNDAEFTDFPGDFERAETFLRNCASVDGDGNPRYYSAPTGAELDEAFTQILTSLGRIRISQ